MGLRLRPQASSNPGIDMSTYPRLALHTVDTEMAGTDQAEDAAQQLGRDITDEAVANSSQGSAEGEGSDAVGALIEQLQRVTQTLREEHGVTCAILGKDGRVVALNGALDEEDKKENEISNQPSLGTVVGFEQTDVVLKIHGWWCVGG